MGLDEARGGGLWKEGDDTGACHSKSEVKLQVSYLVAFRGTA